MVTGGGPTEDKPGISMVPPRQPGEVSHSMTIRVPDCAAAYRELLERGAEFLTEPVDHGAEAYARDELDAERVLMHVVSVREELIAWYPRRGYERTCERVPLEFDGDQRSLASPLTFEILVKRLT